MTSVEQITAVLAELERRDELAKADSADGKCPAPCDADCSVQCHEEHQVGFKREHQPYACPAAWLALSAALRGVLNGYAATMERHRPRGPHRCGSGHWQSVPFGRTWVDDDPCSDFTAAEAGSDGLRPYERKRMARRYAEHIRPPTAAEREQHILDAWRDLPSSVCVHLMANAPGFYFSTARWAAHKDAAFTVGEALRRSKP